MMNMILLKKNDTTENLDRKQCSENNSSEHVESMDERTRKQILNYFMDQKVNEPQPVLDSWIAWLEKQGEQKSADKIEPKFKVGDWVVYVYGEESTTLQIGRIIERTYEFTDGSSLNVADKDTLHLWTIADAKDGDVLVANIHHWEIGKSIEKFPVRVSTIFINQEVKTDNKNIHAYVSLFNNTTLDIYRNMYYIDEYGIKDIHPATKEQRNLLFQKMKEAGYEWNEEKKELKKIEKQDEQKDINPTLIEKEKIDNAFTKMMLKGKPKWTEEDEKNLNDLDIVLFEDKNMPKEKYWKLINWVKSLKQKLL